MGYGEIKMNDVEKLLKIKEETESLIKSIWSKQYIAIKKAIDREDDYEFEIHDVYKILEEQLIDELFNKKVNEISEKMFDIVRLKPHITYEEVCEKMGINPIDMFKIKRLREGYSVIKASVTRK